MCVIEKEKQRGGEGEEEGVTARGSAGGAGRSPHLLETITKCRTVSFPYMDPDFKGKKIPPNGNIYLYRLPKMIYHKDR